MRRGEDVSLDVGEVSLDKLEEFWQDNFRDRLESCSVGEGFDWMAKGSFDHIDNIGDVWGRLIR